jgi:hypothetical protein
MFKRHWLKICRDGSTFEKSKTHTYTYSHTLGKLKQRGTTTA